jgi:hypothetical protein
MVGNLCLQSAAMLSRCWTAHWTLLLQSGGHGIAICEGFDKPRSGQGFT